MTAHGTVGAGILPVGLDGRPIAWTRLAGEGPGLVWLAGFQSDMLSTKASAVADWAARHGRACLRFDYSGHGRSGGRFEDGTIGRWLEESLAAIRTLTAGPQILIGSSMGGWIALLAARALAEANEADRLAGLVLIAPAVDFTEALVWQRLPEELRRRLATEGSLSRASPYSRAPQVLTHALIAEGRDHLLFGGGVRSHCPVHIVQGMQDTDVPWHHAMTLVEHLAEDSVTLTLIKDGTHRLSREADLALILQAIERLH